MKKYNFIFALLLVANLLVSSCSSDNDPVVPDVNKENKDNNKDDKAEGIDLNLSAAEKQVVESHNKFALEFFGNIVDDKKENLVMSPLSAVCNLSILANAADGDTRAEIIKAIGYSDLQEVNNLNKHLINDIEKVDPSFVKLSLANSLWLNKTLGVHLSDEFERTVNNTYNAEEFSYNFDENTYQLINKWADNKTNGLIKDFYGKNDIKSSMEMAILNALYFKGKFSFGFDKKDTKKEDFHCHDGSITQVDMMNQNNTFNYYASNTVKSLAMPFGNGDFELVIALPEENADYKKVMEEAIYASMYATSVDVCIPKFTVSSTIYLDNMLYAMGVDISNCNLSNIITSSGPIGAGVIKVKQKTIVNVDETGAEGASVTGTLVDTSYPGQTQEPAVFKADRPFVYFIREINSGILIFMGTYIK